MIKHKPFPQPKNINSTLDKISQPVWDTPQIISISAIAVDLMEKPNGIHIVPFEVEWDDDLGRSWKVGMEAVNAEDAINTVMSFWHGKEKVTYERR